MVIVKAKRWNIVVFGETLVYRDYLPLLGKKIVVGLTAGAAIYRSMDLIRMLRRMGAEVRVVMTRESTKLIGTELVKWAAGSQPYVETTGWVEHVELAKWCDTTVIAPATLKTMVKIANGYTDELLPLLATVSLGYGKRVIVVPAMNIGLYRSPQYVNTADKLEKQGVVVIPPLIEEDKAKYPPLEDLAYCIEVITSRGVDLKGRRFLITSGATREYIDPVRVITNPSSGLMGRLLALESACRGGVVDYIRGFVTVKTPYLVREYIGLTNSELANWIERLTDQYLYDAVILAAAPVDFTVLSKSSRKIESRATETLTITLKPGIKVAKYVSKKNKPLVKVIFAAETTDNYEELVEKARVKIIDYEASFCIAHRLSSEAGFTSEYLDACYVDLSDSVCYGKVRKEFIARMIIDRISTMLSRNFAH
uniref:Bifunctional phosphopantothenoylcysteine decarboxylase/phosphopantothenate--cysteine ligase CoaBC n=1 Tax=Staphylothermus marinus TaxID=2280 RepID=A0A7C4JMP4_STAMA